MARKKTRHTGSRAGAHRTCAGCGRRIPREHCVRIVVDSSGNCLPDLFGRLGGRGMHLCPNLDCFERASKRGSASRIFRSSVRFDQPRKIAEMFRSSFRDQLMAMLSVASRSAWLAKGRTAVMEDIQSGRVALALLAFDASPRLASEITDLAGKKNIPCCSPLSSENLSKLHDQKALSVVAVRHRGLARRMKQEILKLNTLEESSGKQHSQLTAAPVRGKMRTQRTGGMSAG